MNRFILMPAMMIRRDPAGCAKVLSERAVANGAAGKIVHGCSPWCYSCPWHTSGLALVPTGAGAVEKLAGAHGRGPCPGVTQRSILQKPTCWRNAAGVMVAFPGFDHCPLPNAYCPLKEEAA
jgi:hypothetical protein